MGKETKCISMNIDSDVVSQLNLIKEKSGKSRKNILYDSLKIGLNASALPYCGKIFFIVKARIDIEKLGILAEKLQTGELDTSMILFTFCLSDDPDVGLSVWAADNKKSFEMMFSVHKEYYRDVIEIEQVILPEESIKLILEKN